MALVYDAVRLFAQSLHEIDKSRFSDYQQFQDNEISCEKEEPWRFGTNLANFMRKVTYRKRFRIKSVLFIFPSQIDMNGMSGPIRFDETGSRSDFKLRLLELTREGLKHVGFGNICLVV